MGWFPSGSRAKFDSDVDAIREMIDAQRGEIARIEVEKAEELKAQAVKFQEMFVKAQIDAEQVRSRTPYAAFVDPLRVIPSEIGTPRPFMHPPQILRSFSYTCEPVRAIINSRRAAVRTMKWTVHLRDKTKRKKGEMTSDQQKRAEELVAKIRAENTQGMAFDDVNAMVLDDICTVDAGCIEVVPPLKGDGWAELVPVDGATIEYVLNEMGRFMRTGPHFVQKINNNVVAQYVRYRGRDLSPRQDRMRGLIYLQMNRSTEVNNFNYGISLVQQVIQTIDGLTRTMDHNRRYFEGAKVPPGIIDLGANTTPEDVDEFRAYWQAEMQNAYTIPIVGGGRMADAGQRVASGVKFVPFHTFSNRDMQHLEYTNFLIKVVCAVFQCAPEAIYFQSGGAYKDSSLSEKDGDTQLHHDRDRGLAPMLEKVADAYNRLIWEDEANRDLEFWWTDLDSQDETAVAERTKIYVDSGIYAPMPGDSLDSFNERRRDVGKEPWTQEQWDEVEKKKQEEEERQTELAMQAGPGKPGSPGSGGGQSGGPGGPKGPGGGGGGGGPTPKKPPEKPGGKGKLTKARGGKARMVGEHVWSTHADPSLARVEDDWTASMVNVTNAMLSDLKIRLGLARKVRLTKGLLPDPETSLVKLTSTGLEGPIGGDLVKLSLREIEELAERYMNGILISTQGHDFAVRALEHIRDGWYTDPHDPRVRIPVEPKAIDLEDHVLRMMAATRLLNQKDLRRVGKLDSTFFDQPPLAEVEKYRAYAFSEIKGQTQKVIDGIRTVVMENRQQGVHPYQFTNDLHRMAGEWETDFRRIAVTEVARAQSQTGYDALTAAGETLCEFDDLPGQCPDCARLLAGKTFAIADIRNATNYNKPRREWVPCSPLHPFCRHRPRPVAQGIIHEPETYNVEPEDIGR